MPADVISNLPTANPATESKSARKKKSKTEGPAAKAVATPSPDIRADTPSQDAKANGTDGGSENPYIRELHKNIRNINKKLSAMQKVDAVLAENPGIPLDDLVSSRKINTDQKAQALKKPALQSQLAQLEEQLAQYKKIDQEYQQRVSAEKELLQSSHKAELEKLREVVKAEAAIEQQKAFKQRLLVLSRFLRTAAARRQIENDESEETKAFEGALLLVYGGDPSAVAAAEKLIDGVEESVPSTEGTLLNVTYAQVKRVALADNPYAVEEAWVDNVAAAEPVPPEAGPDTIAGSDPTTANAGLTEQDDAAHLLNGVAPVDAAQHTQAPAAASTGAGAANAAAESQWDSKPQDQDPLTESFEIVPRDPAETEKPAQPAPVTSTQSWADEVPEPSAPPADGNDGFHEVHHRGGRGRGERGGESRGGYRGRGRGGDGRGRGRGGFRGDRGGPRGGFRGGRGRGDAQQH